MHLKCDSFNQGLIGSASHKCGRGSFKKGPLNSYGPRSQALHFSFCSDLLWHQACEPCFITGNFTPSFNNNNNKHIHLYRVYKGTLEIHHPTSILCLASAHDTLG